MKQVDAFIRTIAAAAAALVGLHAHAGLKPSVTPASVQAAVKTVKDTRTIVVQTSTMVDVRSIDQVVKEARAQAIRDIEFFDEATRHERQAPLRAAQARLDAATASRERTSRALSALNEYDSEYQRLQGEFLQAQAAEVEALNARDEAVRVAAMVEGAARQGRAIAIQNAETAARAAAERAARDQASERELQRLAQEAAIKNQALLEQSYRDSLNQPGANVPAPMVDLFASSAVGTAFHCSAASRADDLPGETVLRCSSYRAQQATR